MKRGLSIAAYAVSEVGMILAGGMIVTTAVVATARGLEWLLLWRVIRDGER